MLSIPNILLSYPVFGTAYTTGCATGAACATAGFAWESAGLDGAGTGLAATLNVASPYPLSNVKYSLCCPTDNVFK